MVEHTALSRIQSVVVAVVAVDAVVLVELVVAAAAIAVAAAIGEGVHDVDEGAYVVARADAYAEVSADPCQSVTGFSIMCYIYLHAWP